MKRYRLILCIGVVAILFEVLNACNNKDFIVKIGDKDYTDTGGVKSGANPKILYLIVDGARGQSVRDAKTPTIMSLLPHSIYCWYSLSDTLSNASNWADMLTGVRKVKHKVTDKSFSGNKLDDYPVIFKHIKEVRPQTRISVFASSQAFEENLTLGADVSQYLSTDSTVKSAIVKEIAADTADLIVGQFSGIDRAGAQYGYDNSISQYKAAILQFDSYLGEMLDSLKSSPNYNSGDWLVIIASSQGGDYAIPPDQNDHTIFSNPGFNTFTIYYNPQYGRTFVGMPYIGEKYEGSFARFVSDNTEAEVTRDNSIYNFGTNSEFTIDLKVKINPGGSTYFPTLISKMGLIGWGNVGWQIYLAYDVWSMMIVDKSGYGVDCAGTHIDPGAWNTLTVKGEVNDGIKYFKSYTNGILSSVVNMTGVDNLANDAPLTIRNNNSTLPRPIDVEISELRIFSTALPDSVIKQFSCATHIDDTYPYYNYLLGYWPMDEGKGDVLKDVSGYDNDMTAKDGHFLWENLNDLICIPPPSNLRATVPNNIDIPEQILGWFHIPRYEKWKLDGRVWLSN